MTDLTDDKVSTLPVRFKERAAAERSVVQPWEVHKGGGCSHLFCTYIVDQARAEVECEKCGEKLNPMWVLSRLACEDRRMHDSQERYQEEMKRLAERERTKCLYCGKMTPISRR